MRLLKLEGDAEFNLTECDGEDTPPYAILSHTWMADKDEVSFKDLIRGLGKSKAGYAKIRFCGDQAAKDGLKYFWVDTCCIDKSSSAELSEAINSMFRWYQESSKCYVYLSDVSIHDFGQTFGASRWFKRGWTLQELVAPTSVEFFTKEGNHLGNKYSLVQNISSVTGIPVHALQGHPLSQFSIEERLSWAENRDTKRPEDLAYSLLGLFDIHMPLLYGEGRKKAFIRLQKEIRESMEDGTNFQPLISPAEVAKAATKRDQCHIPFQIPDTFALFTHESSTADPTQAILRSLRFYLAQDRNDQISEAHGETYQWVLQPIYREYQHWDSLTAWLSSPNNSSRIYWINGKPGSGKSTIMRFINQNINTRLHLFPWAENKGVFSARHFFWNAGNKMQKSLNGFLRALLLQLLEQQPDLIAHVVGSRRMNLYASMAREKEIPIAADDWSDSVLRQCLRQFILLVRGSARIFLLIDGLDELDGVDDSHEELITILFNLASFENVKICVSSRPWNIFQDAFEGFPRLKLEDLTRDDISNYVKAQLHGNVRFKRLLLHEQMSAEKFLLTITQKAAGVFLWVRLVVRELLKGLRDGDSIRELQERLAEIPSDLNLYFQRLADSISPQQRREASVLLQIALFEEDMFGTGHPLRLIDLGCIHERTPDFALTGNYNFKALDFVDRERFEYDIDSAFRRLNSCCMGLLECRYHPLQGIEEDGQDLTSSEPGKTLTFTRSSLRELSAQIDQRLDPSIYPQIFKDHSPARAFTVTVDFLHRSCRDFLLTLEIQSMLHQYTQGSYDARTYLISSRLCQIVALGKARTGDRHALALASNVISALSLAMYRDTRTCRIGGEILQPVLETIMSNRCFPKSFWYIDHSICAWHEENSSFLTLAIDFNLVAYVKVHLTAEYIRQKQGRPVLDYILRPRFAIHPLRSITNWIPNLEIVEIALRLGANPNQAYRGSTLWALFLNLFADIFPHTILLFAEDYVEEDEENQFIPMLECMIRAGASPLLPASQLSQYIDYSSFFAAGRKGINEVCGPEEAFTRRWGGEFMPINRKGKGGEKWYEVGDLLERFRKYLGDGIDGPKKLLEGEYNRQFRER